MVLLVHMNTNLQLTALKTWTSFCVIVAGLLLLGFLYLIRPILFQLMVGLFLALALTPLMNSLLRRGLGRIAAASLALGLTLVILVGTIGAIATPLLTQGDDLVNNAPQILDQATANPIFKDLDERFQLEAKLTNLAQQAPQLLSGANSPVLGALGSVVGALSTTGVVLVLAFFLLLEGPMAWASFTRLLGPQRGQWLDRVGQKVTVAVGGFVNGNLFISLIAGIVALVTLLALGVPYAFALAALVAVFDLIPLVGATIATVILGLVALTQGPLVAAIVVGIMLLYQTIEGNFIQPVVYGRTVKLSQLLILVASIIGAQLGGIIGVLLAIPVAAVVQIIVVELLASTHAGQQAGIGQPEIPKPERKPRKLPA